MRGFFIFAAEKLYGNKKGLQLQAFFIVSDITDFVVCDA